MPILRRAAVVALFALFVLSPLVAVAQHPDSRATRESATRVRIEAAAVAGDDCTRFAAIRPGVPAVAKAPPGAVPVTARLERGSGVCRAGAHAVHGVAVLALPAGIRQILLFVEGPDGALISMERVAVR